MMTTKSGTPLYGDWRRRVGTKTDAHLYPAGILDRGDRSGRRPLCQRAIRYLDTIAVESGRPCTDCLVAALTKRP